MMGLRGVRLSIVMPEIVEMQVRAIFEAAANAAIDGFKPKPEVMIPLTWTYQRIEMDPATPGKNCQSSHGRKESQLRL